MGFIKQWNRVFRETVKPVNCEQGKLFIRKNLFSLNKTVYCRVWDSEVVSFPLIYQKLCFDPFRSVGAECDQCSFLQQTSWLPLFSALWAFQGALRPLRVHIRAISASKTTAFSHTASLWSCLMYSEDGLHQSYFQCSLKNRDRFFTQLHLLSLTNLCEGSCPVNILGRNVKVLAMS